MSGRALCAIVGGWGREAKRFVARFYEEVRVGGSVAFAEQVFVGDQVRRGFRPVRALSGGAVRGRIVGRFGPGSLPPCRVI